MELLKGWDRTGTLELIPFQSAEVPARFPWVSEAEFKSSIQLVGPGDRTRSGAAAIEELIRVLPHGPWISWLFHVPLIRPVAERTYAAFARRRLRWGTVACDDHCQWTGEGPSPRSTRS
jgi:predicted DCC family thiol-disulfide oxidoreductase YuxK